MRVLIVGALSGHIAAAGKIAMDRGAKVAFVDTIDAALYALRNGHGADLIMADVNLAIGDLIKGLKDERIHAPVVGCGVEPNSDAAVRAIRAGAKEFLPLPPDAELIAAVLEAVAHEETSLISHDPAMTKVIALARRVAPSDAAVLVTGESGTGKELIARLLHRDSRRGGRPFISVNCAAIPENLLESELFGHEKGAFTGAVARRIGKFEEADGGTLLLDEISEMDPRLQAKLLRAIQEREIDRVGGTKPVKVDLRILATSNRRLEEEVRAGNFREDLYFRLNVINIHVPPLRSRPADIAPLAHHFAKRFAHLNGQPPPRLTDAALQDLANNPWPGNVRELENTMHRAVLLAVDSVIDSDSVAPMSPFATQPTSTTAAGDGALVGQTVATVERQLIIDTLKHTLGNRTHAATILGISIRTLRNKLKQYVDDGFAVPAPGALEQATG